MHTYTHITYTCVCTQTCIHIYICTCTHTCSHTYMCTYTCTHIFTHTLTYTYTRIHMQTHTHTHSCGRLPGPIFLIWHPRDWLNTEIFEACRHLRSFLFEHTEYTKYKVRFSEGKVHTVGRVLFSYSFLDKHPQEKMGSHTFLQCQMGHTLSELKWNSVHRVFLLMACYLEE